MFIFAEKFLREYFFAGGFFLRINKIAKTRTRKNLVPPGSCDFVGAFVRVFFTGIPQTDVKETRQGHCGVLFLQGSDVAVVLGSPKFNFSATLLNSQLVYLPPVGILNLVLFI